MRATVRPVAAIAKDGTLKLKRFMLVTDLTFDQNPRVTPQGWVALAPLFKLAHSLVIATDSKRKCGWWVHMQHKHVLI